MEACSIVSDGDSCDSSLTATASGCHTRTQREWVAQQGNAPKIHGHTSSKMLQCETKSIGSTWDSTPHGRGGIDKIKLDCW
jgi:hypothetical protein